jgi:hypothetical protein
MEFHDWLSSYQLLKNDPAPWNWLVGKLVSVHTMTTAKIFNILN